MSLNPEGNPVAEPDANKWALFIGSNKRILQQNTLSDGTFVSTVFLGIDTKCGYRNPPVLWETMILGGPHDGYQDRYYSREAARAGHQRALDLAERKPRCHATHIENELHNGCIKLIELRGAVAADARGALKEWHAQSLATKCRQYLYSFSVNPDHRQRDPQHAHYSAELNAQPISV